jgi:hypothetical protein
MSTVALQPTQRPIWWVPWTLYQGYSSKGVKQTSHLHLLPNEWWVELYLYFPKAFTTWTGTILPYFSDRKELNKIISLFSWKSLESNRHHEGDSGATLYKPWSTPNITWPLLSKHKQLFPLICEPLTISYRLITLGTWQEITSVK